jgi:hypothetical protein
MVCNPWKQCKAAFSFRDDERHLKADPNIMCILEALRELRQGPGSDQQSITASRPARHHPEFGSGIRWNRVLQRICFSIAIKTQASRP